MKSKAAQRAGHARARPSVPSHRASLIRTTMSATATAPAAPASTVRSLVERLEELGTLPEVTVKINKIVKDPDSSPDDLEEVINHDPALASRVMKIANSSLYSVPSPVKTVKSSGPRRQLFMELHVHREIR